MAVRLIALDLDGTLFTEDKKISEENQKAICDARRKGIETVIATGRPIHGIPAELFRELGVQYVIDLNGACVHRLRDGACIYEDRMETEAACELVEMCLRHPVYLSVFAGERSCVQTDKRDLLDQMGFPEVLYEYIKKTRTYVDDLPGYLRTAGDPIYKVVMNFIPLPDGTYLDYDVLRDKIDADERFDQVDGGGHNMEVTLAGVSKGKALKWLAKELGISIEETMACGDTENDIDMIRTAGIGVAMGNAKEQVKEIADYITRTNMEDGVAYAIRYLALKVTTKR